MDENRRESREKNKNLSNIDYAVYGIPLEEGSKNRGGTRNAPAAIREDYTDINERGYSEVYDVNIPDYLQGRDIGDVDIDICNKNNSLHVIEGFVQDIIDSDVLPIAIGGGNLATLAELRAMKKKYGKVALIHLDSSRDCSDYTEKYNDDTFFIRAMEEDLILAENSVQIGIRGGYHCKAECEYGKDMGVTVLTAIQMHEMTADDVAERIIEIVQEIPCFVTYDMSFLDPVFAPAVTTPITGGFSTRYSNKIIRRIARELNIVGLDIVDVSVPYDIMNITTQAAVSNMNEFLVGMAKRKQLRGGE